MIESLNRTALITGGSRGIGRAVAVQLAMDGFSVAINYATDSESASKTVESIVSAGGCAAAIRADISDEHAVAKLFDETLDRFGGVDVVVNCAGVMQLAPIAKTTAEQFKKTLDINLVGALLVMGKAASTVKDGGAIMAISSSVIVKSFPGFGAYIASKAAVEGLIRVLANELAGRDITVNAIAPGPVATELFLRGKSDADIERLAAQTPLRRIGQPADIANVVSFLAGPNGRWVHGQVLRANGGFA